MRSSKDFLAWAKVAATIKATQETVWKVLTEPELTEKYIYQCQLHAEWLPGETAVWRAKNKEGSWEDHVTAKVLVYEPYFHLAFTIFHKPTKDHDSEVSELHFYLESQSEGTLLRIEQGDFSTLKDGANQQKKYQQGWEYVLPDLIKTCNTIS